jgi:hypothetical protein
VAHLRSRCSCPVAHRLLFGPSTTLVLRRLLRVFLTPRADPMHIRAHRIRCAAPVSDALYTDMSSSIPDVPQSLPSSQRWCTVSSLGCIPSAALVWLAGGIGG